MFSLGLAPEFRVLCAILPFFEMASGATQLMEKVGSDSPWVGDREISDELDESNSKFQNACLRSSIIALLLFPVEKLFLLFGEN